MTSVKRRGDAIRVVLTSEERVVLAALVAQALVIVEESSDLDDPALRRLLPDAYDDGADAREFHDLMDGELREIKAAALQRISGDVTAGGDRLELAVDAAELWLQGLNDVRLLVGTRLDVTEDLAEQLDGLESDDPRLPLFAAYDWLGWLQESLVRAVAQ